MKDAEGLLREHGLRVTRPRLAVLAALDAAPHASAEAVLSRARSLSPMSVQAVYDVLHLLTERGVVRRIQPAGSLARYELRVGDNHHHLVCRSCGAVADVDCAVGAAPCLTPADPAPAGPGPAGAAPVVGGFVVDEAEVTYWGLCSACAPAEGPVTTP